jgi:hypothetical protein
MCAWRNSSNVVGGLKSLSLHGMKTRKASAYKGKRQVFVFVFVGAGLPANGGSKGALPQAKIRLQASSYKGKSRVLSLYL